MKPSLTALYGPRDYLIDYESSRSHSEYFNSYLNSLCREIDNIYSLTGKTVVEIGCGDGHLLMKLRELFKFEGWGFEPSLRKTNTDLMYKDLKFIADYYESDVVKKQADLMILRHVLEHQGDTHEFLKGILARQRFAPHEIYIEVPAWEWIVSHDQVYAFSYEHCSYFSKNSLPLALELHDYGCKKLTFTFEDEYIQYFGVKSKSDKLNQSRLKERGCVKNLEYQKSIISKTRMFIKRIPEILENLKACFKKFEDAVLWGAGGKGTMLLNMLDINYEQLPYVVDSNPRRHNTYIPVTGQRVIAPELLNKVQPKYVLVTNPSYVKEIALQLQHMGIKAKIKVVE